MVEPTFDKHGYPTDETLEHITNWKSDDYRNLMNFVQECWKYENGFRVSDIEDDCYGPCTQYELITGGWSGNESLICAMDANYFFRHTCWHLSERGGRHVYRIEVKKETITIKEAKERYLGEGFSIGPAFTNDVVSWAKSKNIEVRDA
jgi:hypothetical protein